MDMPNCRPLDRIALFVKLRFSGFCLSFSWSFVVVFSHDFSIHTRSLRQAIASGEWLYTQTENALALRLAVFDCISVCIGCGYMVVCRIRVLSVACGTSRALVGSNLFGCGHMKCFVSNCNGKIEMNVSYLELYCSTASSLLCSCRYFLFSSQIKFPFCLAPKITLPETSKSNLKIDGYIEDDWFSFRAVRPIFRGIAAILILRRVPSWERSHIPSQPALLKLMIFLSQGGIC